VCDKEEVALAMRLAPSPPLTFELASLKGILLAPALVEVVEEEEEVRVEEEEEEGSPIVNSGCGCLEITPPCLRPLKGRPAGKTSLPVCVCVMCVCQ